MTASARRRPRSSPRRARRGAHVIGLSILSGSHVPLVRDVKARLRLEGLDHIPVVVGGIISAEDETCCSNMGVAAVYTPKDYALDADHGRHRQGGGARAGAAGGRHASAAPRRRGSARVALAAASLSQPIVGPHAKAALARARPRLQSALAQGGCHDQQHHEDTGRPRSSRHLRHHRPRGEPARPHSSRRHAPGALRAHPRRSSGSRPHALVEPRRGGALPRPLCRGPAQGRARRGLRARPAGEREPGDARDLGGNIEEDSPRSRSIGERMSDASRGSAAAGASSSASGSCSPPGSPSNVVLADKGSFDPFPFILLNLVLSCIAAVQAPVIMMSQRRQGGEGPAARRRTTTAST